MAKQRGCLDVTIISSGSFWFPVSFVHTNEMKRYLDIIALIPRINLRSLDAPKYVQRGRSL